MHRSLRVHLPSSSSRFAMAGGWLVEDAGARKARVGEEERVDQKRCERAEVVTHTGRWKGKRSKIEGKKLGTHDKEAVEMLNSRLCLLREAAKSGRRLL